MTYELLTAILILLLLFILALEYLWLYIMASKQEKSTDKLNETNKKIEILIDGILYSPSELLRQKDMETLKEIVNTPEIFDIADKYLSEIYNKTEDENRLSILNEIYDYLNGVELFSELLKNGNVYDKGYAARRLADFDCYDYLTEMRELANHKKRNVSYNAAMALARLGDVESVAQYLLDIENDKNYSGRIVNEIFETFSMEREDLASLIFKNCNDYMKCTVIKAIAKYGMPQFVDIYKAGVLSKNADMRIACVKALGILKDPENEHILIVASKDRNWVVRLNAVNALGFVNSREAVEAVKNALSDKEWWVRQAAADTLVNMNVNINKLEEIVKGYDRYASDAVKYALYKRIDVRD